MGSSSATSAYLPRIVRQWAAQEPDTAWREVSGSLAHLDVSGFTRLSERLARIGRAGAEELSEAISACFTRLLADAYGHGGTLLKFGGDALLLLFSGEAHAARACRATVAMRRTLREVGSLDTPVGRVRLRMSAGVHSGVLTLFLVGESHRELLVTGPGATEAVLMEQVAQAGEIVVSQGTAARLPDTTLGPPMGPGWLLRRQPPGLSPVEPEPDVGVRPDVLEACVPLAVRGHVQGEAHEPEHRTVTVGFVRFGGTDELVRSRGVAEAAGELHALVTRVQRAADRHGVSFLGSDIDADGGKLILASGAPRTAGDDEERMLLTAREILDVRGALPVAVGVNSGAVFAGDIGPSYRRTYTVMGDAVNLAARLMATAPPGRLVAGTEAVARSRARFLTTALEPFHVKGKRRPVQAFEVGAVADAPEAPTTREILPLVGRDREVAALTAALEEIERSGGRLVDIVGEAGLGKSRLVQELRRRTGGRPTLAIACRMYDAATPYAPWRSALRTLLGIPDGAPAEGAGARLGLHLLESAPQLLPWAPLVARVIDAVVPETPESANLEDQFRAPRLRAATVDLLETLVVGPTVLLVEDVHWMDEASAALLEEVTARLGDLALLVCVTRRPDGGGFVPTDSATVQRVSLAPLAPEAAAALAAAATAEAPLAGHDMAQLVERAGGNPLFLSELVAAASAAGAVAGLPDTLEGLITARIDRLDAPHRAQLRRLSVLGSTFERHLAESVLGEGETLRLDALTDFVVAQDDELAFRHALIRDAAYGTLPYRTRRSLHALVGDAISSAAGSDPDQAAELLSFHYFHAGRYADAWRFSVAAAEAAKAAFANPAACVFFDRALAAARHVSDLEEGETARLWEALGDVQERMGGYREAARAYRTARRRIAGHAVDEARLMLKLARQQGWLRHFGQALTWISRGLVLLEGMPGRDAACQRAQLVVWQGHFLQEQGRHAEAIERSREGVVLAQRCGELEALAHAYRTLDWAHVCLGEFDLAVHSARALALYEELDDLRGQATVLHNMASIAYLRGRWDEALDCNQRSEQLSHRTGHEVSVAFSRGNIAEILFDQGRLHEAEELFREVLRVSLAAERRSQVALARRHLGRIAAHTGRTDQALRLLEEALEAYEEMGARVEIIETQARLAEAHLLGGDLRAALDLADQALARARRLGGVPAQAPVLQRVRGHALALLGDAEGAASALAAALEAARVRDAEYEIALTIRSQQVLADLTPRSPGDALAAEADAILLRLGVVAPPLLPARLDVLEVAG